MSLYLGIIDLHFGNTPPPSINWTQILIALIGPIAGFLTAWKMSNVTQRKNRENQELEKRSMRQEKYSYFVTMAKEVPKITAGQVQLYREHIKIITADPIQFHPPDTYIITALKRLSEANDNEQYLHSFLSASGIEDKQKCTDLFKDLYSYIDHKYFTLLRAYEYHDHVLDEREKITEKYIDTVKDLENYVGDYLREIKDEPTEGEEKVTLDVYNNYCKLKQNGKPNDYRISYESFAIPLAIKLLELNLKEYNSGSKGILSRSKAVKSAFELFLHKNKYEIINFNNLIGQIEEYDKEFHAILEKL